MSFVDKLKSRLNEIKAAAEEALSDFIELVPDEIKEERTEICRSCEFLFKPTFQCKKCGCAMKAKASLAGAECPVGKWHKITIVKQ